MRLKYFLLVAAFSACVVQMGRAQDQTRLPDRFASPEPAQHLEALPVDLDQNFIWPAGGVVQGSRVLLADSVYGVVFEVGADGVSQLVRHLDLVRPARIHPLPDGFVIEDKANRTLVTVDSSGEASSPLSYDGVFNPGTSEEAEIIGLYEWAPAGEGYVGFADYELGPQSEEEVGFVYFDPASKAFRELQSVSKKLHPWFLRARNYIAAYEDGSVFLGVGEDDTFVVYQFEPGGQGLKAISSVPAGYARIPELPTYPELGIGRTPETRVSLKVTYQLQQIQASRAPAGIFVTSGTGGEDRVFLLLKDEIDHRGQTRWELRELGQPGEGGEGLVLPTGAANLLLMPGWGDALAYLERGKVVPLRDGTPFMKTLGLSRLTLPKRLQ